MKDSSEENYKKNISVYGDLRHMLESGNENCHNGICEKWRSGANDRIC